MGEQVKDICPEMAFQILLPELEIIRNRIDLLRAMIAENLERIEDVERHLGIAEKKAG